jgi:hypothetical protein
MSQIKVIKRKVTGFFQKQHLEKVRNVVSINHHIMVASSMLVRSLYLKKFSNNEELLPIEAETFKTACIVVTNSKKIPRSEDKKALYNALKEEYIDMFEGNNFVDKKKLSMSQIQSYCCKNLETAYVNNIQMHYYKYPKKYIRCDQLNRGVDLEVAKRNSYRIALWFYYDKGAGVTEEENQRYSFLFPDNASYPKSRCYDIEVNPFIYLEKMVRINQELETAFPDVDERYRTLFNPLPFHSRNVPIHVRLDTNGLAQLLLESKDDIKDFKNYCNTDFPKDKMNLKTKGDIGASFEKVFGRKPATKDEEKKYKGMFWSFLTNVKSCKQMMELKKSKKKMSEWTFDNSIVTDGTSLSFQVAQVTQDVSKPSVSKTTYEEGKDIPKVTEDIKILAVDPGKHDIAFVTDGVKSVRYTKGQREVDTYTKKRQKVTKKQRMEHNLETFESQDLAAFCKSSCIYSTFKSYVMLRHERETDFQKCYEKPVFRQFKYTQYCRVKSSEDRFALKIFDAFKESNIEEKNCTIPGMERNKVKSVPSRDKFLIGWGDWGKSPNALKGVGPTPGIGFRRSMERYFNTMTVSETLTSKTCPCCAEVTLQNPNVGKNDIKKHHLLRCTNEECYSRWWNRNVVGSYNILYNTLEMLGV